jgi:hypothetical protein
MFFIFMISLHGIFGKTSGRMGLLACTPGQLLACTPGQAGGADVEYASDSDEQDFTSLPEPLSIVFSSLYCVGVYSALAFIQSQESMGEREEEEE